MGPSTTRGMLVLGMCLAIALQCAAAVTHTVGGTSGWIVPMGNAQLFTNWAGNRTFKVGDKLLFNFSTNVHNVLEVTKANYDSCGLTNPLKTYTTGPATVSLNATGAHYFICGIPGHCSGGQKIAITVSAASANSPTTSPSSPPSPSPSSSPSPPSPSSSPSPPSPSSSPSPSSTPQAPSSSPPEASSVTPPAGSPAGTPSSASHLSTSALTVRVGILYVVAAIFFVL